MKTSGFFWVCEESICVYKSMFPVLTSLSLSCLFWANLHNFLILSFLLGNWIRKCWTCNLHLKIFLGLLGQVASDVVLAVVSWICSNSTNDLFMLFFVEIEMCWSSWACWKVIILGLRCKHPQFYFRTQCNPQ